MNDKTKLNSFANLVDRQSFEQCGRSLDLGFKEKFKKNIFDFDPSLFHYLDPNIYKPIVNSQALVDLGIKIDNSGNPCGSIAKMTSNARGEFKIAGDCADDKGRIATDDLTTLLPVVTKHCFAEWTDSEVGCGKLLDYNVVSQRLKAINDIYLNEILQAVFVGIKDSKSNKNSYIGNGLVNNTNFTKVAKIDITGATTPEALVGLFNKFIYEHNATLSAIYSQYAIDTMLISPTAMTALTTKTFSGTGMTALMSLQASNPNVKIISNGFLDFGGKKLIVAFNRSENGLLLRIPQPLKLSSVDIKGFCYTIYASYSIAGLDVGFEGLGVIAEIS